MPAFRQQESQATILNRYPRARAGSSGCYQNRNEDLATGERVWATLSEQISKERDKILVHNYFKNGDRRPLQVGQSVSVNFGRRRLGANVVREIPYSHNVELCLPDGTNVVVDQNDVNVMQNTREYVSTSANMMETAISDSWSRTSQLVIDIPKHTDFESRDSDDAEEKMAAAVLTSLSLSPVLKNFQVAKDELFEDAMDTASDEALSPVADQESNHGKTKLRRGKSSSKTLFQCTWPRCGTILRNSCAISRHIRAVHLGPKSDSDEGYSDGEEEFYFIEIARDTEDTMDTPTEESISPPMTRTTSRRCRSFSDPSVPTQPPVSSNTRPHVDDNFIWPLRQTGGRGKTKRPLHHIVHTNTRKARGDGKKCRKVFGMDNKHLWCTQCRWKKACIRFTD